MRSVSAHAFLQIIGQNITQILVGIVYGVGKVARVLIDPININLRSHKDQGLVS